MTCASGWTDHPIGHVVDVHTYPGPVLNLFPEESKARHTFFTSAVLFCLFIFLFQIYAVDQKRAAVVGEMWGLSRAILGHIW